MAIEQKIRSLHCFFPAGLNFEEVDGVLGRVVLLRHTPYELEELIRRWIKALPEDRQQEILCDVRGCDALTEIGWSGFISWMSDALYAAQCQNDFKVNALKGLEH
ncbi:MAG: hypothetical protein ACOH2B_05405 [Burkholderiaceae bacterium]